MTGTRKQIKEARVKQEEAARQEHESYIEARRIYEESAKKMETAAKERAEANATYGNQQIVDFGLPEVDAGEHTLEEYARAWRHIDNVVDGVNWARGQLAKQVHRQYGDGSLVEFAKSVGVQKTAMYDYIKTFDAYGISERSEISWSVHMLLAGEDDRHELLKTATTEKWSAAKTRAFIKKRYAPTPVVPAQRESTEGTPKPDIKANAERVTAQTAKADGATFAGDTLADSQTPDDHQGDNEVDHLGWVWYEANCDEYHYDHPVFKQVFTWLKENATPEQWAELRAYVPEEKETSLTQKILVLLGSHAENGAGIDAILAGIGSSIEDAKPVLDELVSESKIRASKSGKTYFPMEGVAA